MFEIDKDASIDEILAMEIKVLKKVIIVYIALNAILRGEELIFMFVKFVTLSIKSILGI